VIFIWVWFSTKISTITRPWESNWWHWPVTGSDCFAECTSNTSSSCTRKLRMQILCSATFLRILRCLCSGKLDHSFSTLWGRAWNTCDLFCIQQHDTHEIILKRNSRNGLHPSQWRLLHILIGSVTSPRLFRRYLRTCNSVNSQRQPLVTSAIIWF